MDSIKLDIFVTLFNLRAKLLPSKKRPKNGPNVNRKHLYKLLTDVEPEINVTVYGFHGD
jgi:hypothetical protein